MVRGEGTGDQAGKGDDPQAVNGDAIGLPDAATAAAAAAAAEGLTPARSEAKGFEASDAEVEAVGDEAEASSTFTLTKSAWLKTSKSFNMQMAL